MPYQINVSYDISVDGQTFVSDTRSFAANVYDSMDHTIAKDTTEKVTIADVLPEEVGDVRVLALAADIYSKTDGKLQYEFGDGSSLSELKDPLILFGDQVDTLLNQPGEDLMVKNDTGEDVRIRVLVGRESSST